MLVMAMSRASPSTRTSPTSSGRSAPRWSRRPRPKPRTVLDGLLSHRSGLQIREDYTDTGGATDHMFGFCPFLGFRFAACLRDIKDRCIYLLPGMTVDLVIQPLVSVVLDTRHVEANWDELIRLAVSIRAGTTSASAMLQRLAAYPRQNGLAIALREVGRLERTLFTLDGSSAVTCTGVRSSA